MALKPKKPQIAPPEKAAFLAPGEAGEPPAKEGAAVAPSPAPPDDRSPRSLIPHTVAFPGSGIRFKPGSPMPIGARLRPTELTAHYHADAQGDWVLRGESHG